MSRWLDIAARMQAGANSANSADGSRDSKPIGPIGTNGTGLPANIAAGLDRLRGMAAPKMAQPETWPAIVADCIKLATDGWAAQALALGWSPLQLWGVSPACGGLVDLEGLGIWLAGRRVVLLDATSCLVQSGPHSHSIFNRRPMGGAVLIWEIGDDGR